MPSRVVVLERVLYVHNPTINRPDFQSLKLDDDTEVFSALTPRAAGVAFCVLEAIGDVYCFRPKSQWWALRLLSRQAGEGGFEARHKQWRALWPHLSDSSVEDKVTTYNRRLKEDQGLIGFKFVDIIRPRPVQKDDGSYRGVPTFYGEGDFWDAYQHIQQYKVVDLMRLPRVARLARYKTIIELWGKLRGYQPITKEQKQQKSKPAPVAVEPGGITVARAMSELQRMPRSEQFEFAKDFTETVTSHLVADSQDYDEGTHVFTKIQTAALIGGKYSLDDLRQRISKLNSQRPANPGMRAAVLRTCLDETAAMLEKCEQMILLCETSDMPEGADYFKRWALSLRDFRWAISEDRKGR